MTRALELWAGFECSLTRVHDGYFDQLARTGHRARSSDLDLVAALGARAVRYPVLWETTMPEGIGSADWSWADERLARLRALGLRAIVTLVHHGSGPPGTSFLQPSFAAGLATFAGAVARRYPWVEDYTPVNEPLTTARFGTLYGFWYPHARSEPAFVRALLGQCCATRGAMRAIRAVNPRARLVQTEDFGTVFATPRLAYHAALENAQRILAFDLLVGRVDHEHPMREYLVRHGANERILDEFVDDPVPPDLIGINYYLTSDRMLDEGMHRYPRSSYGGNGRDAYADVEAVRVRPEGIVGHAAVLEMAWRRWGRPVALTEVHLGGPPEQQIRWLVEAWSAAAEARSRGVDVRAVTAWSAVGSTDWDSLMLQARGHYEPGLFDVRGHGPRPTALASVARDLAERGATNHPLADGPGWWREPTRILFPLPGRAPAETVSVRRNDRPILVTGASGTLGRAFVRVCAKRGLLVVALTRPELDIADAVAVARALAAHRPWALVNAAGYVRVDDAEREPHVCFEVNARACEALAAACAHRAIRYVTFSSDLVFDGEKGAPYHERDEVRPLNVYGASKVEAERRTLSAHKGALVVRTSTFFGPWDTYNFVSRALEALRAGRRARLSDDALVSPTYLPDLAHAVLTLLVDGADGVWHLANGGATTQAEFVRAAARHASIPYDLLVGCATAELGLPAARPLYGVLTTEKGALMPTLDDALGRYLDSRAGAAGEA
jgi:dTDP-4-dehydrorhamnose reductase